MAKKRCVICKGLFKRVNQDRKCVTCNMETCLIPPETDEIFEALFKEHHGADPVGFTGDVLNQRRRVQNLAKLHAKIPNRSRKDRQEMSDLQLEQMVIQRKITELETKLLHHTLITSTQPTESGLSSSLKKSTSIKKSKLKATASAPATSIVHHTESETLETHTPDVDVVDARVVTCRSDEECMNSKTDINTDNFKKPEDKTNPNIEEEDNDESQGFGIVRRNSVKDRIKNLEAKQRASNIENSSSLSRGPSPNKPAASSGSF